MNYIIVRLINGEEVYRKDWEVNKEDSSTFHLQLLAQVSGLTLGEVMFRYEHCEVPDNLHTNVQVLGAKLEICSMNILYVWVE